MLEGLIWVVPVAVLAVGLWRPHGGILVLAATLPLFGAPPGGPYLVALDLALLAALAAAWRAQPAPRSRLDLPVFAFVLISLASLVPLSYRPPSLAPRVLAGLLQVFPNVESWAALYTWRAAANLLLGWGLYLAVRRAFHGRSLRPLGVALAAGMAATLLVGFVSRVGLVDLWAYRPIGGELYDTRLHSLFFHSGWLAEYLVLAAPLAIGALLAGGARSRVAALGLAALVLVAVPLTQQRGAWIAVLAQLAVLAALASRGLLRDRRQLRRVAVVAMVVVLLWLGLTAVAPDLVEPVLRRAAQITQLGGRLPIWRASLEMIGERPVLGWGLGAFGPAYESLDLERLGGSWPWLTAHSQYLMIGAERGLLGLLAFGWLAWALAAAVGRGRRDGDPERSLAARGLAVCLAGAAVYGLVQYLFFLKSVEWLFWMLAGATALVAPERPAAPDLRPRLAVGLAALLLVGWRWMACEPLALADDRSFGFHRSVERQGVRYTWTDGRAARRLPREGETLVLPLVRGHPMAHEEPVQVTIRLDGRVVARVLAYKEWTEHRLELGPPLGESVLLELEARPTFRPFRDFLEHPDLPRSRDIRSLGVAVGPIRWEQGEEGGEEGGQAPNSR